MWMSNGLLLEGWRPPPQRTLAFIIFTLYTLVLLLGREILPNQNNSRVQIAQLQSFIIWREWGVVRFVQPIPTRKRQLGKKGEKIHGRWWFTQPHDGCPNTPPLFQSSSSILAAPPFLFSFLFSPFHFYLILFFYYFQGSLYSLADHNGGDISSAFILSLLKNERTFCCAQATRNCTS